MRQRRWLELLKDYDTNIQYHPGKANVVADALSRKSGMIVGIKVEEEIIRDLERLDIELYVKIEHQRASGLLQPLDIPVWKWDEISMDFVTELLRTQRRYDAIWVVVDRLTKSAHFLPIRKDYSVSRLTEIFQQEIMIEVTNAKVVVAKEKLKEARTRQKSYADKHRRSLEFQPGD
nr:retrotransposon protein, putative, Ty3-gypsy subclass [Tanacetum cinerariifolium]